MRMDVTTKKTGRLGFTLLELIITVAILGVVTSVGTQAFFRVTTAWSDTQAEADLDRRVDDVFNEFQADISDAISAELSGEPILGIKRDINSDKYFDRVLSDDMIVLPIQSSAADTRMRTGSKVGWQVSRGVESNNLIRTVGNLEDPMPSGGSTEELGQANVVRLTFEFSSVDEPGKWAREWSRDEHPAAVKMAIVVEDRERPWVQISREAVFPVNVR